MSYNLSDDLSQYYTGNNELGLLNCDNSTTGNCSYTDSSDFYGVSSLGPEDEERLQSIIRVVVPVSSLLLFIYLFKNKLNYKFENKLITI